MSSFQIIDFTTEIPDVCIAMLAYNHEKYITQALDSVLMQQTNYKYKIILAEDKSTDATREIILEYQKKFPDRIKLILQDKNVGASKNNYDLLTNLEGRYIAALEGDDYWTDPLKLQKQVDFLENNKNYVLCGHTVDKLNFKGEIEVAEKRSESLSFKQSQLYNNHIPTLSSVFRNKFDTIPYELEIAPAGDYIIWFYLGQFGDFYLMNETMAVYRLHSGGAWSGLNLINQTKMSVTTRKLALNFLKDREKTIIFNGKLCAAGAYYSLREGDFRNFLFFTKGYLNYVFEVKKLIW